MLTARIPKGRLQISLIMPLTLALLSALSLDVNAQDFGQGPRRDLLNMETSELPQGRLRVSGGERALAPGARSPWHTSGPKLLYVVEGTVTVDGLGGQTYATCGPAPKLCLTPNKSPWFFRNAGSGQLKFVVIGVDSVDHPTIHEEVGTVSALSGNQVTLAIGDARSAGLVSPRREMTITVGTPGSIAVGDDVLTLRLNKKNNTAEGLVKLARRWQ